MRSVFVFLFILSAQFISAQVVSGLYSGKLSNDSTKKDQSYELALSEYRGKITGYSYTTFVRNDSLFYGVKRVKGYRKDGKLVIEDDKMIANNFPESPAKGVRQTNYIQLNGEDTLRSANGTWETNRTKIYYAIGGGVAMRLDNDSSHSALISHLKELKIISQPVYASTSQTVVASSKSKSVKEPVEQKNNETSNNNNDKTGPGGVQNREVLQEVASNKVINNNQNSTNKKDKQNNQTRQEEQAVSNNKKTQNNQSTDDKNNNQVVQNSIENTNAIVTTEQTKQVQKTSSPKNNVSPNLGEVNAVKSLSIPYIDRKKNELKAFEVTSDSLVLAFYDNGVIDGDSISVYVNGENIISNNKLTATATKKIIKVPDTETVEIILVAENLGTLPPNTGLLVVKDGEQTYQVHFSADLQTNASIMFKRKKQ